MWPIDQAAPDEEEGRTEPGKEETADGTDNGQEDENSAQKEQKDSGLDQFMAMNILFVSSSYFLRNIPVAILNKREIIKLKMQRYKDVKVYLYSFILPDYMTDEYVSEQLDALASHLLFPHLILSIANTTIYNPRLVANNVNGIVHIVLCFEHD